MDNSSLRLAVPSDASSLAALSIEVWLGTYLRRGVTSFFADFVLSEFTSARFAAIMQDPNEWIMVSQNEEGIDGYIRVTQGVTGPLEPCGSTEITTFYIQPRHHGKGIGKTLLTQALNHCRTLSAPSVWLATNWENTPAIGFYKAMGFKEIGITHFKVGDEAYENKVFSMELG
jgi:ribosomal protein S18 acetylase RimI-like enzyme